MPDEAKYSLLCVLLTGLSFFIPGGRVLVLPIVFVLVIILLYWSARRSADRMEEEEG